MTGTPRVLVGIAMHEDALHRLKEVAVVDVVDSQTLQNRDRLLTIIDQYEGVIAYVPLLDREILVKAGNLKVIACHASRHIDMDAAAALGIHIALTPLLYDTVAEMTLALLLSAARRVPQAHLHITQGRWRYSTDKQVFSGQNIAGKTLGIVGLGRIGTCVAKRVQGFDMKLLYHDVIRKRELEMELGLEYRPLNQLLREADVVTLHVSLTEVTRGLIGESELRLMKKDAILVNTSRGPLVDEHALYRALNEGWIAAAGLDVYNEEPIQPDNPLLALDNVVFAPHVAGSTKDCDLQPVEATIRRLQEVQRPSV